MLKEFKEFAFKGNVIDMAVGVIIGGAFGKIVTSLVNDIIMPVVGKLTAGVDIKNLKYVFSTAADGTESAILYGQFLQNILDFFIVAFCIFLSVRLITKRRKKKEEPAAPKGPTQEELLTEIRDLLKENAELKQNSIK